jgi:hypothetical protein
MSVLLLDSVQSVTPDYFDREDPISLYGRIINIPLADEKELVGPQEFQVSDATGTIQCEFPSYATGGDLIGEHSYVRIEGTTAQTIRGPRLLIDRLIKVEPDLPPVMAVPIAACAPAARPVLDDLVRLVGKVEDEHLQFFLRHAFRTPKVYVPYFTIPASKEHHHIQGGGHAVHSIETAQLALAHACLLGLGQYERQLCIIGGLLHDIGKIAFGAGQKRTFAVGHDLRSTEVLAASLAFLEAESPQAAEDLRLVLNYRLLQSHTQSLVAELVHAADRMSALRDCERLAFRGKPAYLRYGALESEYGTKRSFVRFVASAKS